MADPGVHLDADPLPRATPEQRLIYPLRRALLRLLRPYLNEAEASVQGRLEALREQVGTLREQVEALREQVEALREQVEAVEAVRWDQTAIARRLAELEDTLGADAASSR